jgi:hypothetical protein
MALLVVALHYNQVLAASALPLTGVERFGDIPGAPTLHGDSALQQLATLIGGYRAGQGGVLGVARPIIGVVAILMIIVSALKMLFADGEEGEVEKAKNGITYGMIGLALISIAGELTKILSVSDEGIKAVYNGETAVCYKTILSDPNALMCRAKVFSKTVQIVFVFIKYLLGSLAVLEVIVSAFRMITLGSEPDSFSLDRKKLIWGAAGFLMIFWSDTIINKVFYKLNYNTYIGVDGVAPAVDPAEGVRQIIGFTNFIMSLVGPIAVFVVFLGGFLYLIAAGEETKTAQAKRIIYAGLGGIIVIYGAFGIVSTIISGHFS